MSHAIACCAPTDIAICTSEARIEKARSAPKLPAPDRDQDIRSFLRLVTGDDTFSFDQIFLK